MKELEDARAALQYAVDWIAPFDGVTTVTVKMHRDQANALLAAAAESLSAPPTEDEVHAEAHRRYDGDTIIDEITGEPTSFDDWGYAECQRQAFIAGVEWRNRNLVHRDGSTK